MAAQRCNIFMLKCRVLPRREFHSCDLMILQSIAFFLRLTLLFPKAKQWTNMLENVRLKQVFDEEKFQQISHPRTAIKRGAFAPQRFHLSCAHTSYALSDHYHFPASHNICCKCFVLPCWSLMRKMVPILVQSRGMPLLLSGILFRIALCEDDQTYKFGQQGQCLLEAITLKK